MRDDTIALIAVLKAKAGQTEALRDAPDTFYMRESWRDQQALDEHIAQPYFQAFIGQMESLLAEPLRLDYLTPIAP
ncbi:antibiotic biosynthesis monooxygenase [Klebsiella aerogenes]|uniref:putative quinol monooxygenase n=1 Tax=Klebsiella aerogenes TaxID=548 RepID=UPI0023B898D0|nr:antibiotic biosynthesis monooxygenase [Klebsiella aerogenes]ELA1889068.1 antibiotic biosynthesis monooxygenase [Klebsiella aerogenes]MDF0548533.1 antibiotic biosynthesis monooxygenase [Klebsiella aerogenes]